jgi:hypothetical protein
MNSECLLWIVAPADCLAERLGIRDFYDFCDFCHFTMPLAWPRLTR